MSHGHTKNGKSPTYYSWAKMHERCRPGHMNHWRYADIKVCERWSSFEKFLEDMGGRPDGTSLDRFPNDAKEYNKKNCRWATPKEQARNRSGNKLLSLNGKTKTMAEWAEITGISINHMRSRFRNGWTIQKTLSTPIRRHKPTPE